MQRSAERQPPGEGQPHRVALPVWNTGLVARRRADLRACGGLRVVLYHHLGDESNALLDGLGVSTAPDVFEQHLQWLTRRYETVDLETVLSGRLPRRSLLITFDDGYRSVLDVAGPILKRLGLPSLMFVSAAFVAPDSLPLDNLMSALAHTEGVADLERAMTGCEPAGRTLKDLIASTAEWPYEERLRLEGELAARFDVDLRRLRAESRLFLDHTDLPRFAAIDCELGNHTRSHVFSRMIVDEDACEHELIEHKRQLEAWSGAPIRSFSYPYGYLCDATPMIERVLAASGHRARFLVGARPNGGRQFPIWNRVSLDGVPMSHLGLALNLLPRLRAAKDRVVTPQLTAGHNRIVRSPAARAAADDGAVKRRLSRLAASAGAA